MRALPSIPARTPSGLRPTRALGEQEAEREANIRSGTARFLLVGFVLLIAFPAFHQFLTGPYSKAWEMLQTKGITREVLHEVEARLPRESVLGKEVRQRYQRFLFDKLAEGNSKVVVGRDGFLFYREDLDILTGPGFMSSHFERAREIERTPIVENPLDALKIPFRQLMGKRPLFLRWPGYQEPADSASCIIAYHQALQDRGIHLLVVPAPPKSTIYPEKAWPGYQLQRGPAHNVDFERWKHRLQEGGVDLLDISIPLWEAKGLFEKPLFLRQDSHWSPEGMGVAADQIADRARPWLGEHKPMHFATSRQSIPEPGDLADLLELGPEDAFHARGTCELTVVRPIEPGGPASDEASILLIGDSFSDIFSATGNPDQSAALRDQLMLRLGTGVQTLTMSGGAWSEVRKLLLERPRDLTRKKLVIWEFAYRGLDMVWAWYPVPLPPPVP